MFLGEKLAEVIMLREFYHKKEEILEQEKKQFINKCDSSRKKKNFIYGLLFLAAILVYYIMRNIFQINGQISILITIYYVWVLCFMSKTKILFGKYLP